MELDTKNSMTAEGDKAEEISVMTRSGIVAIEEVNFWSTAQEEDPTVEMCLQQRL